MYCNMMYEVTLKSYGQTFNGIERNGMRKDVYNFKKKVVNTSCLYTHLGYLVKSFKILDRLVAGVLRFDGFVIAGIASEAVIHNY